VDLIFIDGHHDGATILTYFEELPLPTAMKIRIIVDDIHWSKDMTQAQKTDKTRSSYCQYQYLQWGILFLRKQQHQQAFHINL
jgi:hypothetical protein